MLHILLSTLKIIGILLLCLLGLLLFLILSGMLVPVRYKIRGEKSDESWNAQANLSWLFRLLYVAVRFDGGKPVYECYLFGIPLFRLKRWLNRRRSVKRPKASKKKDENTPYLPLEEKFQETAKEKDERKDGSEEKPSADGEFKETPENDEKEASKEDDKKENLFKRIVNKIKALIGLPRKICFTIRKNYGRIREWKSLLQSEDVKWLKKMGISRTKAVIAHVKPRKIRGDITFGFNNPANTGEVLGVLGVIYPILPRKLSITPNFSDPMLEGWLEARGRVYGIFFLIQTLQILFDGKTIPTIRKYMRKEA